jgi:hypothetical protein
MKLLGTAVIADNNIGAVFTAVCLKIKCSGGGMLLSWLQWFCAI